MDSYPAADAAGMLLFIPALGTPAGFYGPFAHELAARELSVLVAELPGTGNSRPRPSRSVDYGYRDLVDEWLPQRVAEARRRAGNLPLVIGGHSLGAQLACLAALRPTVTADALLTLAGGHIHYRNWKGSGTAKVLFAAVLVDILSRIFGYVPAQHIGFGGPQARTLMREWSRTIRIGEFPYSADELGGDADADSRAAGLPPALSVAYEGDTFAPLRSVAALAAMVDADLRSLPAKSPSPHASWARQPQSTAELVRDWLRERGIV